MNPDLDIQSPVDRSARQAPTRLLKALGGPFPILFGLMLCWTLATPIFGVPDEPTQVIKAAAVARGELVGGPASGPYTAVQVPAGIIGSHYSCFVYQRSVPASCQPPLAQSSHVVDSTTVRRAVSAALLRIGGVAHPPGPGRSGHLPDARPHRLVGRLPPGRRVPIGGQLPVAAAARRSGPRHNPVRPVFRWIRQRQRPGDAGGHRRLDLRAGALRRTGATHRPKTHGALCHRSARPRTDTGPRTILRRHPDRLPSPPCTACDRSSGSSLCGRAG